MFKFPRTKSRPTEEELLRRAMGQLYDNTRAREHIRRQLRGRDVSSMSEAEIYALVREVISDMRRLGISSY